MKFIYVYTTLYKVDFRLEMHYLLLEPANTYSLFSYMNVQNRKMMVTYSITKKFSLESEQVVDCISIHLLTFM